MSYEVNYSMINQVNDDNLIPSLRFPQKLWRIVNECNSGSITWSPSGLTILLNYKTFQNEYLDCENSIFKTTNIASFIRQLNLYGFRKVTSHNRDLLNTGTTLQEDVHEFLHEHFRAGRLDLLSRVCRKTGIKKIAAGVPGKLQQGGKMPLIKTEGNPSSQLGMSRLQMCQIGLGKALEQATRQYRKEKFLLQLSDENVPTDASKPKYKTEIVEPKNIQIIFQDLPEVQDIQNITMIDASNIGNVINLQDKIQWEEVFTIPAENQVTIQYHVNENFS